jgi:hypothetical protein
MIHTLIPRYGNTFSVLYVRSINGRNGFSMETGATRVEEADIQTVIERCERAYGDGMEVKADTRAANAIVSHAFMGGTLQCLMAESA